MLCVDSGQARKAAEYNRLIFFVVVAIGFHPSELVSMWTQSKSTTTYDDVLMMNLYSSSSQQSLSTMLRDHHWERKWNISKIVPCDYYD